ncbi:MAG: GNAT family N-acetyltransferase [Oxalobacter formigenes]|nr:GNAT family N-acetyltransferase [Oxalobacter formigenes]
MKVDIRPAAREDIRDAAVMRSEYRAEMLALAGLEPEFLLQEDKARLLDFLDNDDYVILMAHSVRGHPLGLIAVFESAVYQDDLRGVIEQIYIRPFYRRRKIARRLLSEIRQWAKARQCRRLTVTLPPLLSLEPAYAFFQDQGFTPSGSRKQWLLV